VASACRGVDDPLVAQLKVSAYQVAVPDEVAFDHAC